MFRFAIAVMISLPRALPTLYKSTNLICLWIKNSYVQKAPPSRLSYFSPAGSQIGKEIQQQIESQLATDFHFFGLPNYFKLYIFCTFFEKADFAKICVSPRREQLLGGVWKIVLELLPKELRWKKINWLGFSMTFGLSWMILSATEPLFLVCKWNLLQWGIQNCLWEARWCLRKARDRFWSI